MAVPQESLEITSDLKELSRVRLFVRGVCDRAFDPDAIRDQLGELNIALTEAVSNVIVHAYQRQSGQPIRIEAGVDGARLTVRILHRGAAFDPEAVAPPDLDEHPENHMGMYIIRHYTDEVTYHCAEHGEQCVQLVKVFKLETEGDERGNHS